MRKDGRRGVALITVLILLATSLYFVTALLVRSNNTLFMVDNHARSTRALYIAEAAAAERGFLLTERFCSLNKDADTAVAAARALYSGASSNTPVYNANGTVIGYADVSVSNPIQTVNCPVCGKTACKTVTITSTGSTRPNSEPLRLTRRVQITYHLETRGSELFNFAYFMNHWAWFQGFGKNQAQIIGNTAANGNYDVLNASATSPGYLTVQTSGAPALDLPGAKGSNSPYAALDVRAQNTGWTPTSVYGTLEGTNSPKSNKGHAIETPHNLTDISNEAGEFISKAKAWRDSSTGNPATLEIRTYTVDTAGNPPKLSSGYTVKKLLTNTGVYGATGSGQKENVVLAGTPVSSLSSLTKGASVDVISISGPIVVRGNVVMQGLVEGRGTLYAGRNVYVAGSVQYKNGPSVSPSNATSLATSVPLATTSADINDASLVSYVAGGSVVYGDVTSSAGWSSIMGWFNYVDPTTGQRVNDNHEDMGSDGMVNSKQTGMCPGDSKENDNKWTVELQDAQGNVHSEDLPVVSGTVTIPNGYTVVPGSGEDADGNGRYTGAYNYNRDFLFASRQDSTGAYTPQTFSATYFDNFPSGVASYASYNKTITRVDGYVMSNNAIAGWLGDNANNVVFYGAQIGRQECMILALNGKNQLLYQDTRLQSLPSEAIQLPTQNYVTRVEWQEL